MPIQERVVSRRQVLRGAAIGMGGLAGAALLGCESEKSPEDLFKFLLTTPLKDGELPKGLVSRGITAVELDATLKSLQGTGMVHITVSDVNNAGLAGGIGYAIFKDTKGSDQALNVLKSQFASSQSIKENGIPPSAISGKADTLFGSVHMVAASIGNVLVFSTYNNSPMAIELAKSAIAHLNKVK